MSIAIVCGYLWFSAGKTSLIVYHYIDAGDSGLKKGALISASMYIFAYLLFVALFGIVMNQINYRNSRFDKIDLCGNMKKKFRRSSDEFIWYSMCGLVSIWICIMCTVGSAYAL